MSRTFRHTALLAACLLPPAVLADEPKEDPAAVFNALDADNDGVLARDEVGEDRARFLDRMLRIGDRNDDGRLTREEYLAAINREEPPTDLGTAIQRGGPGGRPRIVDISRLFETADRDGDGKLTLQEIPEGLRRGLQPLFDRVGKTEMTKEDFERLRDGMNRGRPQGLGDRRELLRRLDRNDDGKLSSDEIPEQARRQLQPLLDRFGGEEIDLSRLPEMRDREVRRPREADRRPDERQRPPFADRPGAPPFRGPRDTDRPGPPFRGRRDTDRPGPPFRGPRGMDRPGPPFRGPRDGGLPEPALVRVLDIDGDGQLSPTEFAALAVKFAELDRNGDGRLAVSEIMGIPGPFADRRDGDRNADRPRRADSEDAPRPRRPDSEDSRRPRRPESADSDRPESRRPSADGRRAGLFERMDANDDGSLSETEAPEPLKRRFDRLDTDGDGKLSREEFRGLLEGRGR